MAAIAILVVLMFQVGNSAATDRLVVTLLYFRGTGLVSSVRLEWATGSEFETAGYRIERSDSETGPRATIPVLYEGEFVTFVPAAGDIIGGAHYEAIDSGNLQDGHEYWYTLVEVETNGAAVPQETIGVTAGLPQATNTPQPSSTATRTPSATPTAVSATLSPTAAAGATDPPATALPATSAPVGVTPSRAVQSTVQPPAQTTGGGAPTPSSGGQGQQLAQTVSTPDPGGYPGPTSEPIPPLPTEPSGYPAVVQPTAEPDAVGYPEGRIPEAPVLELDSAPREQPTNGLPTSLEASQPEVQSDSSGEAENGSGLMGTAFLWGGFLAGLIIFAAGVYGSIVLFSRNQGLR